MCDMKLIGDTPQLIFIAISYRRHLDPGEAAQDHQVFEPGDFPAANQADLHRAAAVHQLDGSCFGLILSATNPAAFATCETISNVAIHRPRTPPVSANAARGSLR